MIIKDKSVTAVRVYDKIAEKYSKTFQNPSDFIDKFISFLPRNAKVLDVGCGPGQDTNYMFRKGLNVEGIDLSETMIGTAKKRFPEIKFLVMDMRNLEYPDNYFDGLLVSFSLIHIPNRDIDNVLSELRRVLKNKGIMYIGLQEGKGEKFVTEPLRPKEKMFLHYFTLSEISKLLKKFNFEILFSKSLPPESKEEFLCNKLFIISRKLS